MSKNMFKCYLLLSTLLYITTQRMPPKQKTRSVANTWSTRANPCNGSSTGKELIEARPMVPIKIEPFSTPSTNASRKSQRPKKVTPTKKPKISK
jgi:hypothetical protein